ncbi:hypothetical protein VNI00_003021 [Paramarasmius palmivorus]|uniref:Uncharacterized protein n=1 Tax=Paramarasmius palmivorus TaxID=297713 RepID=A0AAW0DXF5_9AGAR
MPPRSTPPDQTLDTPYIPQDAHSNQHPNRPGHGVPVIPPPYAGNSPDSNAWPPFPTQTHIYSPSLTSPPPHSAHSGQRTDVYNNQAGSINPPPPSPWIGSSPEPDASFRPHIDPPSSVPPPRRERWKRFTGSVRNLFTSTR